MHDYFIAACFNNIGVCSLKVVIMPKHVQAIFFYCCTVHFDICRVHSPTNALFNLKNTLKFTLKYT